jgi:hypothetical protein
MSHPSRGRGLLFQYFLVAMLAFAWGALGRVALDWFLRAVGFHERHGLSMLSFAIGPVAAWAGVAVILWTPLTQRLRRATVKQSLKLGGMVVAAGTILLYALFLFQMGVPTSGSELLGAFGFFPVFLVTAGMLGGFLAVPITLATALFFRGLLRAMQPPLGSDEAA